MTDLAGREFTALRATIRARGTARLWAFLAGMVAWAALLIGILIWLPIPLAAAVPLLVLLATFEVVRAFHLGVERVGRYVQAFFEEMSPDGQFVAPAWERTAMAFGPSLPGAGVHPFFLPVFILATLINFLAVLLPQPMAVELSTLAVPHLAFVVWMLYCDRGMRKQRATELARYRAIRDGDKDEATETQRSQRR
jgi:hypothetical protein